MPRHTGGGLNTSNGLSIVVSTTDNAISVDQNGNVGGDPATDGAIHIENTGNTGIGLGVYTNIGSTMNEPLVYFYNASTSCDENTLYIRDRGTGGAVYVNQDGAAPAVVLDQSANATHLRLIGDPANSSPVDGDLWYDGTNLKFYDGTTTTNIV